MRSRGGLQVAILLSAAKTSSFSLTGMPDDLRLVERQVLARLAQARGEQPAIGDVGPVVGLPLRHEVLALGVGRLGGDHVVEHLLEDVGGVVDDVGPLVDERGVGAFCIFRKSASASRCRSAVTQIASARAAHARSPMRLIGCFDAKNSAHIQNAAKQTRPTTSADPGDDPPA